MTAIDPLRTFQQRAKIIAVEKQTAAQLLSLAAIEAQLRPLASRIGAPNECLPTFGHSRQTGKPHIEVAEAYFYVTIERGYELDRQRTESLDELLYWMIRDVTFLMASHWEYCHRRDGENWQEQRLAKQGELLAELSTVWAARALEENRRILERRPLRDPYSAALSAPTPARDDEGGVVRVFVSSTFLDMQRERDELVRTTFPALRARFRARGVELLEVDLRWGITMEQAESGKLLPTLLAEIDRCRPYFVGLLGQRYGWTPPARTLTDELKASYPTMAGAAGRSITEMEIIHGVLGNPETAKQSLFFERDPAWLERQSPGELAKYSIDSGEAQSKLASLKDRIRKSGAKVITYNTPDDIGHVVEAALGDVLEARYPETQAPDAFTRSLRLHAAYARERRGVHVGAGSNLAALDQWLANRDAPPVLITGVSGGGKSTLVANWLQTHRHEHPNDIVFEHYLGASPDSADPKLLMRRLWDHLNHATGENVDLPAGSVEAWDLKIALGQRLAQASLYAERTGFNIIVALDGLDKLSSEQHLIWLPDELQPRVRLLASSLDGDTRAAAEARGWTQLEIKGLTVAEQREFIDRTLDSWGKSLSPERIGRILAHPLAGTPLFLKTLLDELRYSGIEAKLDSRLDFYLMAQDLPDMFARLLERLEGDCGVDLVSQALSLIWASRGGLEEGQVIAITEVPPLAWATLRNGLGDALRDQMGCVTFSHDFLRQAVEARYLPADDAKQNAHRMLVRRYLQEAQMVTEGVWQGPLPRGYSELLFHLRKGQMWDDIVACLNDASIIVHIPKRTYGFDYESGLYGGSDKDALSPDCLTALSGDTRASYGLAIAEAFGSQARACIKKAYSFPTPWPATADALREGDRAGFAAYRDTFYYCTRFAGLSADWAFAALTDSTDTERRLDRFLESNGGVASFMHYLGHFGNHETGLSHALEDDASGQRYKWERLYKLRNTIRSLRENGDVPSVVRPVDVRFSGEPAAIERLGREIISAGWRVIQIAEAGYQRAALDVQRDQTTDAAALFELAEAVKNIASSYYIRCDGWEAIPKCR